MSQKTDPTPNAAQVDVAAPAPSLPFAVEELAETERKALQAVIDAKQAPPGVTNTDQFCAILLPAAGMNMGIMTDGSLMMQPIVALPPGVTNQTVARLSAFVNPQQAAATFVQEELGVSLPPVVRVVVKRSALKLTPEQAQERLKSSRLVLPPGVGDGI